MSILLWLGATPLCLFGVAAGSVLAGAGLVSPYLAAAAMILATTTLSLPLPLVIFATVGVYFGGVLLSQVGSDGAASAEPAALLGTVRYPVADDYLRGIMLRCLVLKIIGIVLGALIPIPAFPPLTGPVVLIGACALAVYAARGFRLPTLAILVIQSLLLYLPIRLIGDAAMNPILGLISAVAIPAILFAPRMRMEEQADFFHISHNPFRYLFVFFALVLSLSTPGYSLSCIAAGLFPRNLSRFSHLALLEGWMEGYVLKSIFDNAISGKTPLGDLLSSRPLFLDAAEIMPVVHLSVIIGVMVALAVVFFTLSESKRLIPLPSIPSSIRRNFLLFALAAQAFVTVGLWAIPLLILGVVLHFLREMLDPNHDTLALAFLLPISLA